jgi:nucleoside-triphosphatase
LEPKKRIWLITGDPGSGKTTVVSKLIFKIRSEGYTVGGVLTREVRSHGERVGFKLVDLSTEESADLSSVNTKLGPRVGKYRVELKTLSGLGAKALKHARENSDLIVIDEIGPMELYSPEFRKAVSETVLKTSKPCICIVHKRLADPVIEQLKNSPDCTLHEVTYENRNELPDKMGLLVLGYLKGD